MVLYCKGDHFFVLGKPEGEDTGDSPLLDDEDRNGFSLEYKYKTSQTDEQVKHQLKANMYLLTVKTFLRKIVELKKNPTPIRVQVTR